MTVLDANMQKTIFNFLNTIPNVTYFLAGSRRFGYYNERSDWDFCIIDNDNQVSSRLPQILIDNNFYRKTNSLGYTSSGVLFSHRIYPIHIIVFHNQDEFTKTANDHKLVKDFCDKIPHLQKFINILKINLCCSSTMTIGACIYKLLVQTVKE